MAFNPFSAFQKNQKIWMAGILLICMITFVFCTGMTGMDLGERIIRKFQKRGETVVAVGSYSLTYDDLVRLRNDRNMINEMMRKCADLTIANLTKQLQDEHKKPIPTDPKKLQEQKQVMAQMVGMQASLTDRLRKANGRWFEGGVKMDDLIEFITWQTQADRLGIRLLDEDVDFLFKLEFFSPRYEHLAPDQIIYSQRDAARGKDVSDRALRRALTEEYRVRLAQLACLEMQPFRFVSNLTLPLTNPNMPDQERLHVTLAQLWKVYQEKRSEFEVTLIPVHVDDFTKEVFDKGAPTDAELEKLFDRYKKERYDPTSPLPSYETPMEIKAEYVMADPTAPIYVATAKAKELLQQVLPLVGAPMQAPALTAARYGAVQAGREAALQDVLRGLSQSKAYELYGTADLGSEHFLWPMAAHLAQRDPQAIASLWGNLSAGPMLGAAPAWTGYLGEATVRNPEAIKAATAIEVKRRSKPYAEVAAASVAGEPLAFLAAAADRLKLTPLRRLADLQFLPLPIIAPDLEGVLERRDAQTWATRNLLAIKKELERNAKPEWVRKVIKEDVPKYHLTHVVTKEYYSRYTIDKAPELQPLRELYEKYAPEINWFENRALTPDRMLREGDFYKLFFDSERFASTGKYQVRAWPPEVYPSALELRTAPGAHVGEMPDISPDVMAGVQRFVEQQGPNRTAGYKLLDKAQKPTLYWRSTEKPAEFPQKLADARERVVAAWKTEKAREDKAIPLAKKIAEELVQADGDFTSDAIAKAGRQAGHAPIRLDHIAPWAPKQAGEEFKSGQREYFAYRLPKDAIAMPRDDMVSDLLSLVQPKRPFEVKTGLPSGEPTFVKQLNDLNKSLYEALKKDKHARGKYVQVLTNKPETVYYVAVVTKLPFADPKDFQERVIAGASTGPGAMPFRFVDTFAERAQDLLAKEYRASLLAQIRQELGFTPPDESKRTTFDSSDHGG